MPGQMKLSWDVDCANSSFGPAEAAAKLDSVVLYVNDTTDPVLGQFFGLTVAADDTEVVGAIARRTLTLNMDPQNSPTAPPPFPCHPFENKRVELPYPFREKVSLVGVFTPVLGSTIVRTTTSQIPALSVGDVVQFMSQQGIYYEVTSISPDLIGITPAFAARTSNTTAFKEKDAPATLVAVFSTSDLDTATVSDVVPPIPNGVGCRGVIITYDDSAGNGPFTVDLTLTGTRPKMVELDPGSVDMAVVLGMRIDSSGNFGNNVGQITLVEVSEAVPAIPPGLPHGTGIGPAQSPIGKVGAPIPRTWITMTDEAQLLIARHLVYLPPSFFALAQQAASQTSPATSPTAPELATVLGQFVSPATAIPPGELDPHTVPIPTFLSSIFTKQIQLALAGVPVAPRQILFA